MLRATPTTHLLAAAVVLFLLAATCIQADPATIAEDGRAAPVPSPGVIFLQGTTVDQALGPALASAAPVPVIVVLKDQPTGQIASQVQAVYLPQVQQRAMAVRAILAKYAGKRDFISDEEMQAQARLEAQSVSAADRAMKKQLNQEADDLLGQMRKEMSRQMEAAVANDQAEVSSAIVALGGKVTYGLSVQNAVAAIVPGTAIAQLSRHPLVSYVMADHVYDGLLNVSGPTIFVNTFWAAGEDGGIYDGAVCDSGVDTAHPALDDDTVGARTWYSHTFHDTAQTQPGYNDNPASTDDLHGHGTHVAGIMLSSNGTYRGVAFGTDCALNLKAGFLGTDGDAHSYDSDVRAAMHWAQGTAPEEPEVVNYSYGGGTTADDDGFAQFFDAYTEQQMCTTTVAAGNSGPGDETILSPSFAYNCICVANMDDRNTVNRADDIIRNSSSRGPTHGGRRKPDITAPGTDIMSCNNLWEGLADDFVPHSGTSMAAPHVGGAALLLNDAGRYDPREIKAILINTAEDWGDPGWDKDFGWGYVDLHRAYLHRNDVFLNSVYPRLTAGDYHLYKTTGMDAGEAATMTWYRHAVWNGSSEPTTVYPLNDLNLRLYDEATNAQIDSDLTVIDNVHQVTSDRSGTQVIRAYAWSTSFASGSTETYALATQEGTTLAADPTVTPSSNNYIPPLYAKFNVSVLVENTGDVAAHNCSVTLSLPSGVILAEGSLTQNLGTINAGSYAYAYYKLDTTSAGVKTVTMNTTSSSYGLTFTGSGSFTVTPGAQDTVAPYTTMRIGTPTYQTGGTDLVTNGGFESGVTGWTTSGTETLDSAGPHSGAYDLKLGPGSGSAYQTLTIDAGASHATLTFWYKSSASIFASVGCRITDSSGNTLIYPFSSYFSTSTWTKVTIDLDRFVHETIRVYFYSTHNILDDSTMYVDDVTLKGDEFVYVEDTSALSLTARDENSGIDYTEYRIGTDPYATYVSGFTLAGKSDGYHDVDYRSQDNGGNWEPTNRAQLILDTQPPVSVLFAEGYAAMSGGTEKTTNGGFESGTTGWTTSGAVTTVTSPVHGGLRAAKVGETGAGSVYQDIPISAGASRAFLEFWVKSTAGTAGTTHTSFEVQDPVSQLSCDGIGWNGNWDWKRYTYDVTRFKGRSVRLTVAAHLTSGTAGTIYLDDVRLRDNANLYIAPSSSFKIWSAEFCGEKKYEHNVDAAGFVEGQTFSVSGAGTHTVAYRVLDNLDHQEPSIETQVILDDAGPTGSITINGGAQYTTSLNVTLGLYATDPAGVSMMRIRSDAGVWGAWQPYASYLPYTLSTAGEGTKTVSVEYQDVLGNVGAVYSDSIIYQVPALMDIPGAKKIRDGEGVRLKNKIITAVFPWSGYFYIEEEDRRSGIRVRAEQAPGDVGDIVGVDGVTDTVYHEREIVATAMNWVSSGPVLAPLGMTNGCVGGGPFGYQEGAFGASGLNNTGLLVRTTGRVAKLYAGHFYIADGSSFTNPWPPEAVLLIDNQALAGWVPPLDMYLSIAGISGMEDNSLSPIKILRPRSMDDVDITDEGGMPAN